MSQRDPRDVAANHIRNRLSEIQSEIDSECYAREVAYDKDWEFRMSDAHLFALRAEKTRLQEVMGDL